MLSQKIRKCLSKLSWAEGLSYLGTRCGQLFARKRSDGSRKQVAAAKGSKFSRRRRMWS